jgi:hypothetical protein
MIVAVTRLHVRRCRYLPSFAMSVWRIRRQVRASAGFIAGGFALEQPLGFWTFTVWAENRVMRAFRNAMPHQGVMARLLDWCDEASYVHWEQDSPSVPTMEVAFERMRDSGKLTKVHHPSASHVAGKTTSTRLPKPVGRVLRARKA